MSLAALLGIGSDDEDELVGVNLVDFSQIVISTITNTFEPTDKISIDLVRHACLNVLRSHVMRHKDRYPRTVVCVDNRDGYWRREVAYYYKKHRAKDRETSEWDWDTIHSCMNTVIAEMQENMPYTTLNISHAEADDCIGVLTRYILKKYPTCQILITSSDGDFTQLHTSKNVKQYSPIMKTWVKFKHGSARNDLRYKIIKGDKKDCIAGIKSPSDYYLVREADMRAPAISTKKYLEPLFAADDPLELDIMSEEEKKRYRENEILLDFNKIPATIARAIIDEFENGKIPPRSKLYPYFVRNGLSELSTKLSEFY